MKKFLLLLALCSLFLIASCGGGSKDNDKTDSDSAETVTDEESTDTETSDTEPSGDTEPASDTEPGSDTDPGDTTPGGETDTDTTEPETTVFCSELDGISGELTTCKGSDCETDDCPGSNSCQNATECGECRNYTVECHESGLGYGVFECQTGIFHMVKECAQGCNEEWNDCGVIECNDGDTKCVNGNDYRGETYSCVDGRWKRDKDVEGNEIKCAGSCNKDMTRCGESDCIDYVLECRDDLLSDSTGGGAIAQCQFGKWQIMSICTDGSSCNKETGNCGECKNDSTKCEDHEVNGIMNKNCNSSGNCDSDSGGNLMYYSGTIGIKLLCYDGRWSDYNDLTRSTFCPAVNHTFQSYQSYAGGLTDWSIDMTKVFNSGATTYNDYHYSSCHNTEQVSECGSCHNNFRACSDVIDSNKPLGRIMQCYNGVLTYGNFCGNKTQLCKNHLECKN